MTIALWILNIFLAVIFIGVGGMKVFISQEVLSQKMMLWAADFSSIHVKLIGFAEVAGGLGLVLPLITGNTPLLAPIAAICLAVSMVVAGMVHLRRKESPAPAVVAGILCIASSVLGFANL